MKNIQLNIAKFFLLLMLILTGCSEPQILEDAGDSTLIPMENALGTVSENVTGKDVQMQETDDTPEAPGGKREIALNSKETEELSGNCSESISEREADSLSEEMETGTECKSQEVCYVHISGAVKYPGVYQMEPQARLYEAVMKAGGFEESASEDYCNLAQTVVDGMRYYIPTKDEVKEILGSDNGLYLSQEMDAAEETMGSRKENQQETKDASGKEDEKSKDGCYDAEGRLDINQAGVEELTGLQGIGTTRAEAIIAYRSENGSFQRIEDLMKVSGIKEGTYNQLKDKIVVR